MTDYWKSNERKFCDYCNCWIADNKSSIVFHEGGKKHKANVAKKLYEIGKKSQKDEKERQKMDMQFRQMEDAAMKAYQQDILRGGDMTTQTLNAAVAAAAAGFDEVSSASTDRSLPGPSAIPRRAIDPMLPPVDVLEDEERQKKAKMKRKINPDGTSEQSMWVEAKSDEGHTYFWNVKNGESVWKVPKEGYMTIEEYNRLDLLVTAKAEQQQHMESKYMRENATELVSKYNREKLKAVQTITRAEEFKAKEEERETYETYEEAGSAGQPFGKWQTVVVREVKPVDLQLPAPAYERDYAPVIATEYEPPPPKVFKEKTVKSLDDDVSVSSTFKKRKFGGNKRNVRQKLDDDE